ncbi:5-hydroxytryptamine receptor 1A-alpha-like isoform X5 [Branchiostoma floridae]|uniref:5-hydroxytryptamine receptor 1A-alpha-like isoform X5 n=1 Tax=Branchiostoma floridae TaxID=7739 RepID=A0A9J7LTN4_BRAFL|nr:5-hydroxytryptamine receptor 1A-alpha-like isoform X5 [Branchiostoma floridae]
MAFPTNLYPVTEIVNDTLNATMSEPPPPSLTWAILTGTSLSIVTLTSILGNALVLVTLTVERHLRTPANSLIGSLAVADLLVSLLVMPISASYELTQTWRLGRAMCDIWIILDVTCCTASIMSLCIIALDRYWAITDAVKYVHKRTPKRMMVMIGVVWLLSLCISIPPVFGWRKPEDTADPNNCLISQDHAYTIFSTFGAFYIPLIIVLAVYYKIFRAAQARIRKRINSRAKMGLSQIFQSLQAEGEPTENHLADVERPGAQNGTLQTGGRAMRYSRRLNGGHAADNNNPGLTPDAVTTTEALQSRIVTQKKILFSKERKAAQTLGVITGVFVFCWLPFFLVALIGPFCSHCHISDVIKSVVLWLGYVNSMVNPFLYAFLNKDFQKSFKKILFGRR